MPPWPGLRRKACAGDKFEGHQLWLKSRGVVHSDRKGLETMTSFMGMASQTPWRKALSQGQAGIWCQWPHCGNV